MKRLLFEPVIIGNVVKAALTLAVTLGLAATDANIEAIVALVTSLMAAYALVARLERAAVTPVAKVTEIAGELGGTAVDLVEKITGGLLDATTGKRLRRHPGARGADSDSGTGPG